jgi:DnaJ-class molecular chaperone
MIGPTNCANCDGDGCKFHYPVPGRFELTACSACDGLGKVWSDGRAPTSAEAERWILNGAVSTNCAATYRVRTIGRGQS